MGLSDLASLGGVGAAVGVLATYGTYTGISMAAGQRCGFNSHDFERFFESAYHRQRPKAPREGAKGFGDHEMVNE
ncbi:hypothetical protein HpHCM43_10000 [Helicobacter pylori]